MPFTIRFNIPTTVACTPVIAILWVALAVADFSEGYTAWDRGDYVTAMKEFRPLAEQGSPNPQWLVGKMYHHGYGVPKDYREASKWYQMAAERGLDKAQNDLGTLYEEGMGVAQDYLEAIKWYRLAAEQGLSYAQFNLAELLYADGHGPRTSIDLFEVRYWYRKAAWQGHAKAIAALKERFSETLGPQSVQPRSLDETIVSCVHEARKGNKLSKFDAYRQGNSVISFGTPEERFKFNKCMSGNGVPLDQN